MKGREEKKKKGKTREKREEGKAPRLGVHRVHSPSPEQREENSLKEKEMSFSLLEKRGRLQRGI